MSIYFHHKDTKTTKTAKDPFLGGVSDLFLCGLRVFVVYFMLTKPLGPT